MPLVSEFLPTISLNAHIFRLEIPHVCKWRSGKSFLNFAGSFICPILWMQKFSTRRRSRSLRAVEIHGSEWRSGTSEELLKCLFVLTIGLNRLRKRSASSTITFRIHSPLQSNLRWKPACKRSLLLFNFPQRKTRIRQGTNPSNILHGNAVLAPRKHNSLDG